MLEIFEYLANAGQRAPSADNSQPWFFSVNGQTLSLYADLQKIKPSCFDANHPAILLTLGAVIENIIQAANWIDIEMSHEIYLDDMSGLYAKFIITKYPDKLPDNAYIHPLFFRTTNRLAFDKSKISTSNFEEILKLSNEKVTIQLFDNKQEIQQLSELVKIASEIRFQTPDIHEWFGQSLKFTTKDVLSCEGLDVNTLGLPLPGKLVLKATQTWKRMRLLNYFGTYKLIANMERAKIKNSTAMIGLLADSNKESALVAGRVMERLWIDLNLKNISAQPYFVISDQLFRLNKNETPSQLVKKAFELEKKSRSLFGEKFIYILFRIGHCKQNPVKSLRRKVSLT